MPISIKSSLNDTVATNFVSAFNSNAGVSATIDFFDGILPAVCEDPDDGTLLVTLTPSASVFASPAGNSFTMNSVTPGTVVADGTLTYWRLKDGSANVLLQGDCGTDPLRNIVFDNEDVLIGDTVSITSFDVLIQTGGP